MLFMKIFWILIGLTFFSYFIVKRYIKKWDAENVSIPIFLLATSFLIVAIATKDPLFSQYGVPAEYEWVVGAFIAAFVSWKVYFNPMKLRIGKVEGKVEGLDVKTQEIDKRADVKIDAIHKRIDIIQLDIHLMKEKLLKL